MPKQHFLTPPQTRKMRLPAWFKVTPHTGENYLKIRHLTKKLQLNTVCEEARCPNIWECWNAGTATFMIMGDICTRSCGFCDVAFGRPEALDLEEPKRVAEAVARLGLKHAVITSVDRDELAMGGAEIFVETIQEIRKLNAHCAVEILIPDFQGKKEALNLVFAAHPDILAHNVETVPRLHRQVRPQAQYQRSLDLLVQARDYGLRTKTGLMLGLGETMDEVKSVMQTLAEQRCEILTLGQYLQPSKQHLPIERFVSPEAFLELKEFGEDLGIEHVESGPLVRSSYHAERQVKDLSETKENTLPIFPS